MIHYNEMILGSRVPLMIDPWGARMRLYLRVSQFLDGAGVNRTKLAALLR